MTKVMFLIESFNILYSTRSKQSATQRCDTDDSLALGDVRRVRE